MRVWLLICRDVALNESVKGVFASKELATKEMLKRQNENYLMFYRIKEEKLSGAT